MSAESRRRLRGVLWTALGGSEIPAHDRDAVGLGIYYELRSDDDDDEEHAITVIGRGERLLLFDRLIRERLPVVSREVVQLESSEEDEKESP